MAVIGFASIIENPSRKKGNFHHRGPGTEVEKGGKQLGFSRAARRMCVDRKFLFSGLIMAPALTGKKP